MGVSRERLLAEPDCALTSEQAVRLTDRIARRMAGEPLAYLVGYREFYGRPFAVDARVLIPRADSELLVDLALLHAKSSAATPFDVLELGTGSGILAVTLALEAPHLDVVATDLSGDALDVARGNADRLGARIRFIESDWFAFGDRDGRASPRFDLIVSNPPYIAVDDGHLNEGDLRFEPRSALTDGGDGLSALRHLAANAPRFLRDDGAILLEHGYDQAAEVRALLVAAGFAGVASHRDLAGIERVTCGTRAAVGRARHIGP